MGWYPVSPNGDDEAGALITLTRKLSVDPEHARHEYVMRYHRDDPFAPGRLLDSSRPLLTMADIGGREGLASTLYGSELLPEYRVEHETALYIRDGRRMLGAVRIGRTAEDGEFGDHDLDFLQRAHLLLQGSYVSALEPPPNLLQSDLLTAHGLTAREAEVACLVVTGATNLEIGRRLMIRESTVKTHLLHAFAKLDVRSRTELAAWLAAVSA